MRVAFCVCLFMIYLLSEIDAEDEEKSDLGKNVEAAALATGHPEVAAAIELIQAFHKESSISIGEKQDQFGFNEIMNKLDHSSEPYTKINLIH